MVPQRAVLAHKPSGIVRNKMGSRVSTVPLPKSSNHCIVGQPGCSVSNSQTGHSPISVPTTGDLSPSPSSSGARINHQSGKDPRRLQHACGPTFPEPDPSGMASNQRGHLSCVLEMGCPVGGPIFFLAIGGGAMLCNLGSSRRSSIICRRAVEGVGLRSRLGVPSPSSSSTCPPTPGVGFGNLSDGDPPLAEILLESGDQGQGSGRPNQALDVRSIIDRPVNRSPPSSDRRPSVGGLEGTGWNTTIED